MATNRKRSSSWNGQIRKKGHPTLTISFIDLKTALEWDKIVESVIDMYIYLDISAAQRITVGDVLERFSNEVLPTKKSGDTDKSRISTLKTYLGKHILADLKPYMLSEYRDFRLKSVKSGSVSLGQR